jgi:hypothetical protein
MRGLRRAGVGVVRFLAAALVLALIMLAVEVVAGVLIVEFDAFFR